MKYQIKEYLNLLLCRTFGHKWTIYNYSDTFIDFKCKRCIIKGKPLLKRYFKKHYKQITK